MYIYIYVCVCVCVCVCVQWTLDLRKPHTKNLEYETGFEEISVLLNEKNIQITKIKFGSVRFDVSLSITIYINTLH